MSIEQLRVNYDNFCYIISDESNQAAVVDPGIDETPSLKFLTNTHLDVQYIIATHYHSDHVACVPQLQKHYPQARIVLSSCTYKQRSKETDIRVTDNSHLMVGSIALHFILTPGHSPDSMCIIVDNSAILTGDTLFIDDCGRCDLSGGSLTDMYHSLQNKIRSLPDALIVYPGHDYGPKPFDSLGNQHASIHRLITEIKQLLQKQGVKL